MTLFRLTRNPIRVTLVLSVLIHAAALWKIPQLSPASEYAETRSGPLVVRLAPPPSPPAVRARPPEPQPQRERVVPARPERPAPAPPPRPPAQPPVITRSPPAGAPPPAATPSYPAPPAQDLASYVEARQLARGEIPAPAPAPPTSVAAPAAPEDPNARANRIAAANLGLDRRPTYGPDTRKTGGVFELTYTSPDYAEFLFYGWNRDIQRDATQKIEVRRGQNPDIRIAVVRRMIGVIRQEVSEDFTWESHRLNRVVNLSARARDTAGLEDFLMREFFDDARRPASR